MEDALHNKKTRIWTVNDPQNRSVSLYEPERDHIMKHDLMAQNFSEVYYSIQSPKAVYESGEGSDREVYFRSSEQATYGPYIFTKTVVQFNKERTEGRVVTAFPSRIEGGNIGERTYPDE